MKPALSPCKPCVHQYSPNKPAVRCVFCKESFCFTHLSDPRAHPCVEIHQKAQPKAKS
mgnify:FL=1